MELPAARRRPVIPLTLWAIVRLTLLSPFTATGMNYIYYLHKTFRLYKRHEEEIELTSSGERVTAWIYFFPR